MITIQSPLNARNIGSPSSIAMRELPGLYTLDLRAAPGNIDPGKPGQVTGQDPYTLCLAPDWWLWVSTQQPYTKDQHHQSIDKIKDQHHCSIVDVSDQRTTIELEGPNARNVLSHVWEQDLREKTFPIASVSQGLIAKAPVIVWHLSANRYRVMPRSSFALHVWKVLVDAAVEYS